MKILILVDIQNDFCPGGALAVKDGDQVVAVANRLMKEGGYDLIVATKDWHPADHLSFAANNPGRKVFELINLDGLPQVMWPNHCVQNSNGAEFHPDLDASKIDRVFVKGTNPRVDSYGGFYDNGGRGDTGLKTYLEQVAASRGVSQREVEIDVCGLATDYCVGTTALQAVDLGYKTSVIYDGCRAVAADTERAMLARLIQAGVNVIESRVVYPERNVEPPRSTGIELSM